MFDRQEIGCFALTECRAGVLSGLICDTTATVTKDSIILDSSSPGLFFSFSFSIKVFSKPSRIQERRRDGSATDWSRNGLL